MKIVALQAENIKRLTAIEIRPDGNLVEITGKNGAGKTSVLDSIWWCLAGKDTIQTTPIRKGCEEASIALDLGTIKVRRAFRAKEGGSYTTSIVVENADGARFPSPQSVLDALLGELTFDPLAFTTMKPREQFDTLRRFVPGVDFDALQREYDADYAARTAANRRAKEQRAVAEKIAIPAGAPCEMVDEAALIAELDQAHEKALDRQKEAAARQRVEQRLVDAREGADRLAREIEILQDKLAAERRVIANIEKAIAEFGPLPIIDIDTTGIRQRVVEARATNDAFRRASALYDQKAAAEKAAKAADAESAALSKRMAERETAKAAAIAAAEMPVPGLSFGDGIVLLNGVPFDQGSDAEQLRASIAIAAAMNPKLRVIRVRDGSRLDEDGMHALAAFAAANDVQVWIETVSSGRRHAVLIEDGSVAEPVREAAE